MYSWPLVGEGLAWPVVICLFTFTVLGMYALHTIHIDGVSTLPFSICYFQITYLFYCNPLHGLCDNGAAIDARMWFCRLDSWNERAVFAFAFLDIELCCHLHRCIFWVSGRFLIWFHLFVISANYGLSLCFHCCKHVYMYSWLHRCVHSAHRSQWWRSSLFVFGICYCLHHVWLHCNPFTGTCNNTAATFTRMLIP